MGNLFSDTLNISFVLANIQFAFYFIIFVFCLYVNFNFNTVLVGVIYFIPLFPLGLMPENAHRFLMVSFQNLVFGTIELVIFVITVEKTDVIFNEGYIKQFFGHTCPIASALIGLSLIGRVTEIPFKTYEFSLIIGVFLIGSILRILAVYQIGVVAFKFDIVFRQKQRLKSDQLYSLVRHPSYFAMMLVILAYALNTHNLMVSVLGLTSAWLGFQYRVFHEEKALEAKFGEDYRCYRAITGMWFPKWRGKKRPEEKDAENRK